MENTQSIEITKIFPTQQEHSTHSVREFQSEFVCLMHGASPSYGYIAAQTAADTAVWGYKEIRKRQCYWIDKKLLLERIIRTTNIALWQKHKEKMYEKGLTADGVCCIFGQKTVWIGCFGQASVLEIRKDNEQRLMGIAAGNGYDAAKPLGSDRYILGFSSATLPFVAGDTLLFAVGSCAELEREELLSFQDAAHVKKTLTSTTGSMLLVHHI